MAIDENAPLDDLEVGGVAPEAGGDALPPENDDDPPPGDENDEHGDAAVGSTGNDEQPAPRSRGEARIQRLANERAEALAKAQAAEQQVEFFRRQAEEAMRARQQPQVDEPYVDPDERWRRETESKVNQALFSANDLNDKAAFTLAKAQNPLYGKYEQRVEAELQAIRARGGNATREGILDYLIGKDVRMNQGKTTRSSKQAAERVTAARQQPVATKGNVPQQRSDKSLEDRLRDTIL